MFPDNDVFIFLSRLRCVNLPETYVTIEFDYSFKKNVKTCYEFDEVSSK